MSVKYKLLTIILFFITSSISAQQYEHSGVYAGIRFENLSHQNPYVHFDGPLYEPQNLQGFQDKTQSVFIPFGWSGYSTSGFGEFHTAALNMIVQGIINSSKDHKPANRGSNPGFREFAKNTESFQSGSDYDLTYWETDLFRGIYAGNIQIIRNFFGILLGFQGGVGKFGTSGLKINSDGGTTAWEPKTGVVSFNDGTDLYYGWNTGFTLFPGFRALFVSVQYDYHYFIKGVKDDSQRKGNRLFIETTFFPFDAGHRFSELAIKFSYRRNKVPYMQEFSDWAEKPITYTNKGFALGFSYYILGR